MEEKEFNKKIKKLETEYRKYIFFLIFVILKENERIKEAKEVIESEIEEIEEADKIVFETIFKLHETEEDITSLKVKKTIKEKWNLSYQEYFAEINKLVKANKKKIDFDYSLTSIKDTYKKIKLLENLYKTSQNIDSDNYDKLVDTFNQNVDNITVGKKLSNKQEQFGKFKDRVKKAKENFGQNQFLGFTTYIEDLDNMCLGIDEESFNIIAARPAMGKSALILSIIANHIKNETGETMVMFSLEMPADQLIGRIAAILSNVKLSKIRSGDLTDEEIELIFKYSDIIESSNLIIEDEASVTIHTIADKLKTIRRKGKIGAVFIDYLQLINGPQGMTDRRLVVDEISRKSKLLAKELQTPIIALSQLNRKLEERADKRPMLSDLRESGGLEQDADRILFVYRQSVYEEDTLKKTKESNDIEEDISELILAKNRNGAIGTVYVKYLKQITYFKSVDELEVELEIINNIQEEIKEEATNLNIDIETDKTLEIEIEG